MRSPTRLGVMVAIGAVVLAGLVGSASVGNAQRSPACPPPPPDVFFPCHLDVDARPLPDRLVPAYPRVLQSEGIGGTVRVRYTIDSSGRATRPFDFLASGHELLTAAVRIAMVRWRFSPGIRAGRPVAVVQEEVFEFLNDGEDLSPLPPTVLRRDTTPDGVPRTIIGHAFLDTAGAASLSRADEHAAQRAAIDSLLADAPRAEGADLVVCVQLEGNVRDPDRERELVDRFTSPGRQVARPADCPRTYQSWLAGVDSLGRRIEPPPGWVDPHWLTIIRSRPWNRDLLIVDARVDYGNGGVLHRCVVQRRGAAWEARCTVKSVFVS